MSNQNKVVHSQGRQIIYNVYNFMKKEKEQGNFTTAVTERVAKATGVGLSTVKRICKEAAGKPEGLYFTLGTSHYICFIFCFVDQKFLSPRKTIQKSKPKSCVDGFDEEIIRKIIYTYPSIYKKRPTMAAVFQAVKEDGVNFEGKLSSFRAVVRKMGFRWQKTEDNRKMLIEKTEIRAKRVEFLRKLKQYKDEGRNIVYTDETYLHSSHTVPKSWDDGSTSGIKAPVSKGQRLIIVHAGGCRGFIPNALLIFKSGLKTGDYHDEMNHKNHVKWFKEKLIPNLEPNSVIVIDNASYHNVSVDPNPTSAWKKADMQAWLSERNIFYEIKETKPELYTKIQINRPKNKVYVIDSLLAKHGHAVLRLPPYHPDLNPIEKIWALVKNHVATCNTTFKLDDVWKLAVEKFNNVGVQEWQNICAHVAKAEQEYMKREYFIDQVAELVIRVGADSDDSDYPWDTDDDDEDLGCQPLNE